MGAVDPTYPLYPIACLLAAAMLLSVLLTSLVRQSWNLGVAFLCFWLFWDNLFGAVNAIIWSDNGDIRLYVYCDIGQSVVLHFSTLTNPKLYTTVTHVNLISYVVRPMATLIIARRLHIIATYQSIELPSKAAVRASAPLSLIDS